MTEKFFKVNVGYYRKSLNISRALNTSRASNTSRGSDLIVLIEAGP